MQHGRSGSIFGKVHYMKELSSQLLVEYTIFQILEGKALKKRQSTPGREWGRKV